jgi:hypothetical protein
MKLFERKLVFVFVFDFFLATHKKNILAPFARLKGIINTASVQCHRTKYVFKDLIQTKYPNIAFNSIRK